MICLVYHKTIVPAIYENMEKRIDATATDRKKVLDFMRYIRQHSIVENLNLWPK